MLMIIRLWVGLPVRLPSSRLGHAADNPIYVDSFTTFQDKISYERLLIDIDVTLPYKEDIDIEIDFFFLFSFWGFFSWGAVLKQVLHNE